MSPIRIVRATATRRRAVAFEPARWWTGCARREGIVVVVVVVVVAGALPSARTRSAVTAAGQPGVGVAATSGGRVGAWGIPNSVVEMALAMTV